VWKHIQSLRGDSNNLVLGLYRVAFKITAITLYENLKEESNLKRMIHLFLKLKADEV